MLIYIFYACKTGECFRKNRRIVKALFCRCHQWDNVPHTMWDSQQFDTYFVSLDLTGTKVRAGVRLFTGIHFYKR